jgi:hypothetical protein
MSKKLNLNVLATAIIFGLMAFVYVSCQDEEDIAPPVITLTGDNPFYLTLNQDYVEPGFTVKDQEDGTISPDKVNVSSNVNKDETGTYKVTYSVSDNAGNTGVTERTVIVRNSAEFLAGDYLNAQNSCQNAPVATFNGTITVSDIENGKFTIQNFGGHGTNVSIECHFDSDNNQITAPTGQSLGGTLVLESLNMASVTNNSSPVEFFVNYNWRDGAVGDVCNSTYTK